MCVFGQLVCVACVCFVFVFVVFVNQMKASEMRISDWSSDVCSSDLLYGAAYAFLGHLRGGLAMATILACGGFSAVSGSSLACAATMTKVSVPTMRQQDRKSVV